MDLKHYVPISVGVFAAAYCGDAVFWGAVRAVRIRTSDGETVIGLQLEDVKVSRFLEDLAGALKPKGRAR